MRIVSKGFFSSSDHPQKAKGDKSKDNIHNRTAQSHADARQRRFRVKTALNLFRLESTLPLHPRNAHIAPKGKTANLPNHIAALPFVERFSKSNGEDFYDHSL